MSQPTGFNLDILIGGQPAIAAQWAKNQITKQFFQYLQAERATVIDKMIAATDVNEMMRLSGEVRRLSKILELPSVLEQMAKNKAEK